MVTQKDIHNTLVENASPLQKSYISMKCGGNPQKIMEVEQRIANLVNSVTTALTNAGTDYLNKKIDWLQSEVEE